MKKENISRLAFCVCGVLIVWSSAAMADDEKMAPPPESEKGVYLVFTEKPMVHPPQAYYIHLLTSLLGSEEAAEDALIHTYTEAATGFSAKLTPQLARLISRKAGVVAVSRSHTYHLDPSPFDDTFKYAAY